MTPLVRWGAALALLTTAGSAGAAIVFRATSAVVDQPGDDADVCVTLESGGAQIAGTQNDLDWDGSCAMLSDPSACGINPSNGKQLFGSLGHQPDFAYRAFVLSLSDVSPIPDGELYCCTFQIEAPTDACCAISVKNAGASDPSGLELGGIVSTDALVCVGRSLPTASPTVTSTVTPTPRLTPAGPGDSCFFASDCATNFCVDSICCNVSECPGGQHCGADGTCTAPTPTPTASPYPSPADPCGACPVDVGCVVTSIGPVCDASSSGGGASSGGCSTSGDHMAGGNLAVVAALPLALWMSRRRQLRHRNASRGMRGAWVPSWND
jgi:uncharacterized protein (TIGR03382 family)